MKDIVHFILNFYAPMWFQIKQNWKFCDGAKNQFEAILLANNLPGTVLSIIKKYIQKNAFFAHPEAIIISMLCDEDGDKRNEAVTRILNFSVK